MLRVWVFRVWGGFRVSGGFKVFQGFWGFRGLGRGGRGREGVWLFASLRATRN